MIQLIDHGVYLYNGEPLGDGCAPAAAPAPQDAREQTMAYRILRAHDQGGNEAHLRVKFDSLTSHDITYMGILQTAKASGLQAFPVPYVLTNCHNSLCAVGGTLNEDDHVFGLSAAKKYGGIFVPAHQSVIHSYAREMSAACGAMILGSDSHTRYGALGCMGVGEGGPELVKQLLSNTYDIPAPQVIAVYLTGTPRPGVGPQDVSLAIIKATYQNGFVKNKVMEFMGPGVANLSVDFRCGIDVMTTETTCLSSIWVTDEKVADYYRIHGRPEAYSPLAPGEVAYYDGMVMVDLSKIEPMIALPFHPSNAYTIRELNENPYEILQAAEDACRKQIDNPGIDFRLTDKIENGRIKATQGVIAGCSGGIFENIMEASAIVRGHGVSKDYFSLNVYPASAPVNLALMKNGAYADLIQAGAIIKTAFCGPCFGAGDTPANNGFSLRHTTRNFPNREGSKPGDGQISSVALMDARSIAATAINGGYLTSAMDVDLPEVDLTYSFDGSVYERSVYNCWGKAQPDLPLKYGPNIADWPQMQPLSENLLLRVAAAIHDPVTTTDELIPSGETSTYRSNPYKLAEFTLSRKDPGYVARAKSAREAEAARLAGENLPQEAAAMLEKAGADPKNTALGSLVYANCPGDGSAREQAASCQRVLGGVANIAQSYATKRYRSNLINWGIVPFVLEEGTDFAPGVEDYLYIPGVRSALLEGKPSVTATALLSGKTYSLLLKDITPEERDILLEGSLINHYAKTAK